MAKRRNPIDRFARDLPPGTLEWIGVRTARRSEMVAPQRVMAIAKRGLEGDHRMTKTPGSARQVTIISREFIQQITQFTGKEEIQPNLLRRNLVISGMNLNALRYQQFTIGNALFEANALCHPCSRMETALGKGGVAAMLGYGGLCARIIRSGEIEIGDTVLVQVEDQDLS
jgi:MOSC domain-containing protein YiiM